MDTRLNWCFAHYTQFIAQGTNKLLIDYGFNVDENDIGEGSSETMLLISIFRSAASLGHITGRTHTSLVTQYLGLKSNQ